MRKTPETILALDPGLRDLGYAVLHGRRLVTSGVLGLRRVPKADRLETARKNVRNWLKTHRPNVVVVFVGDCQLFCVSGRIIGSGLALRTPS